MFADDMELDEKKAIRRRRSSLMVRRLILEAFGVRSYDYLYFRTNYPLEDHLHIDPVSIFCAVVKKVRTYSGSVTLVNQGIELPALLMEQHKAKQRSAMNSERQMLTQTAHLDQEERERHMTFIRAIASGSQETADASDSATAGASKKKKARKAK